MDGILLIDKPSGMTSHDVVAKIRRIINLSTYKPINLVTRVKVGHGGTLDPLATGVLPILIGNATKLADKILSGEKEYLTTIKFGETTDTDDAEGKILETRPVTGDSERRLKEILPRFLGVIEQIPPIFSAIKLNGVPSYKLARKCSGRACSANTGKASFAATLKPRLVEIKALNLESVSPPYATICVRCSKGTYIRALARDLGEILGCGGHVFELRRLASGSFKIEDAGKLEEVSTLQDVINMLRPAPLLNKEVVKSCSCSIYRALPDESGNY